MYIYKYASMSVCLSVCMYVLMYIYVYVCICMYNLNLEGIQYDIIDTSSFMLQAIFCQYFLPTK